MSTLSSVQQSSQTDFEISTSTTGKINTENWKWFTLKYLVAGIFFGILLIKTEVVSWYRIQEMFRFQSFHMYGVIGSAVGIGALSVWLLKRFKVNTISGEPFSYRSENFIKE